MLKKLQRKAVLFLTLFIAAVTLTACGGGGGGGNSSNPSPSASITLSGVVASGSPVANGGGYALDVVSGKIIPFTTDANGKYSVVLNGYSGPFLLHVIGINSAGSPVNIYSLATVSNSGGTVNITPLSDVVLGYAAGVSTQSLESYCTSNLSACPAQLTSIYANLSAANTSVVNAIPPTLASSLPSGFNVFNTPFNADHTGVDYVLDKIAVTPAAGTGAGTYNIALVAAPTTPVVTVPTTGTVGTQSSTPITSTAISAIVTTQAAHLEAIVPEIQTRISSFNTATTTAGSYSALAMALTPLLDATFLNNGANKTTYLTATAAGSNIQLGTVITGGALAAYSGAPLTGATPGASVTYDGNNCVMSVWVHLILNGVDTGTIELLDTGYNTTTCLGGTWTIAGNQRQFVSRVVAQSSNLIMTGGTPFTKTTIAMQIPDTQALAYTKVVVSGPGLVTLGAQATPSPVIMIPTATNLDHDNSITDIYYGMNNIYTGGIEGSGSLVSCAWIGTHSNGWGASSSATPCFNDNAVAGSDYTIQFYNGTTLVETDMERLAVTPSSTIPSSWYPVVTSVTPACTGIPVTGATVTVNWTMPTGSVANGVFLNLNDGNWNTVNNTRNLNLGPNATSAALATGPMFTGAPAPSYCVAAVATTINDISVVTVKQF